MAVGQRGTDDKKQWCSAGLMVQQMPTDGGHEGPPSIDALDEDDWRRTMVLMDSCKDEELLSEDLNSHAILLRLFHEEGVRVFSPTALQHQCRCSEDKVKNVFKMLSEEEQKEMAVEGKINMVCEFCSKGYELDPLL